MPSLSRWREERARKRQEEETTKTFMGNDELRAIKPKEGYIFHGDYFQVDDGFACVLMYYHTQASTDNFDPFWGILLIPEAMPDGVITVNFEQIVRMSEHWVREHQGKAEGVSAVDSNEATRSTSVSSQTRANRRRQELMEIAQELSQGSSYLNVHNRLLVKAPSLEVLEEAVASIERLYTNRFATVTTAPYIGDQRREMSQLFARNAEKRGKGEYFTSAEFAGAYNLVTHGIEDANGEYVGQMVGDVNNSAVIFDVDNFRKRVVVGSDQIFENLGRSRASDVWAQKIAQACLLNGGRVVHLLMDKCDMTQLGPTFDSFSHVIDMNHGEVNMFEMFGERKDSLSIFPSQMQKLALMAEQAIEPTENERSIIRNSLEEAAKDFYIAQRMWFDNASENFERLRIVGLKHTDVPRLQNFVVHLQERYEELAHDTRSKDVALLGAYSVLLATFRNMLSNNNDLFNQYTTDAIDSVKGSRRVIYDFSSLLDDRGRGIAMAQLVNIVDLAVSQLGRHDVVVVHSAENIDSLVSGYVEAQFDKLFRRGGRVALCYGSVDAMINAVDFNHFDKADYTLVGNMTDNGVVKYQKALGQNIPGPLARRLTNQSASVMYVRRGFDNVVFRQDPILDYRRLKRR